MLNWCCIDLFCLLQAVRVLILSGKTGGGLPGNGGIDRGLPHERAAHHSNHRGVYCAGNDAAQRGSERTPRETCVYNQMPFCPPR